MEDWSEKIFSNPELAYFINFSKEDSKSSDSFLDYSKILRDRVTQDPRVIADIVRVLVDWPLATPRLNYGDVGG